MPRAHASLWLARPTRFAALTRRQARTAAWLLALLLIVACAVTLRAPGPPPASHGPAVRGTDRADVELYQSIVDGVRHGGHYYAVAAAQLRAGDYPLRPFLTFRLPTLALIEAWLPPLVVTALLYLLAAAVMLAWFGRLRPTFQRGPPLTIALILLAGGMVVFVHGELDAFHEVWAGPLIALSLALRRPGRWIEPVCLGLIAMLIRETALLYVIVMAAAALLERERREAAAWGTAILVFAAVVMLHASAVAAVVTPLDPQSPGWSGLLGFGFFIRAVAASTVLTLAPLLVSALLVALALFGWAAWRDPTGLRALATILVYAALIGIAGRPDTFYWALMIAPIVLLGLAFAPDGIADLAQRALDRRRITVTRMRP